MLSRPLQPSQDAVSRGRGLVERKRESGGWGQPGALCASCSSTHGMRAVPRRADVTQRSRCRAPPPALRRLALGPPPPPPPPLLPLYVRRRPGPPGARQPPAALGAQGEAPARQPWQVLPETDIWTQYEMKVENCISVCVAIMVLIHWSCLKREIVL
ncbi:coiled-coil domain-containing protein 6-like [Phodopus roborovskii]|uniref:coiled-coil domain-containing protein 6-like n=1 Tax=Phodopus roborovskii TaxID=109678 RepID=UPI0021E46E4E|nr:coiled-coil domain-containing protein 6-like [Phodopus roborovskii]